MSRKIILISAIVIISLLALLVFVFGLPFDVNGKATGIFSLKCTDSDGGLSFHEKGFVKYDGKTKTDSCNKNYLTEWYCKQSRFWSMPKSERHLCENECKDGACIKKGMLIGTYCEFNYQNYPNKEAEAKSFFNYCEQKLPLILNSLNSSIGTRKVILLFEKGDAPAWTVGDDRLFINADSTPQYPGFILHEGTHFVQNYQDKTGNRGWVMEGLADFVRFKLSTYSDEPGWAIGCQGTEDYTSGYGCAAAFFSWLENYCSYPNIQIPLNEMILAGSDTDKVLNQICGLNLETLWNKYKSTNPPERIYPPK